MSEQIPAIIARSWSSIPEKNLVRIFDNPAIFAGGGGSKWFKKLGTRAGGQACKGLFIRIAKLKIIHDSRTNDSNRNTNKANN